MLIAQDNNTARMVNNLSWHFQTDRPIYLQLEDRIKLSILSGEFAPGEKLTDRKSVV